MQETYRNIVLFFNNTCTFGFKRVTLQRFFKHIDIIFVRVMVN